MTAVPIGPFSQPIEIAALPTLEMFEGVSRRILHGERMSLTEYRFAAEALFPEHAHPQEQLSIVIEGEADFVIEDSVRRLSAGSLVIIPPHARHAVRAGPEGARVLSAVAPSRAGNEAVTMVGEG